MSSRVERRANGPVDRDKGQRMHDVAARASALGQKLPSIPCTSLVGSPPRSGRRVHSHFPTVNLPVARRLDCQASASERLTCTSMLSWKFFPPLPSVRSDLPPAQGLVAGVVGSAAAKPNGCWRAGPVQRRGGSARTAKCCRQQPQAGARDGVPFVTIWSNTSVSWSRRRPRPEHGTLSSRLGH